MLNILIALHLIVLFLGLGFAMFVLKLTWHQIAQALITIGFTIAGVGLTLMISAGNINPDAIRALVIGGVLIVAYSGVAFWASAAAHANDVARERQEANRNQLFYKN